MSRIAIVAMGLSAHAYLRVAERSGNRTKMFDEVWVVNGFGHVFQYDRMFHMDDIRLQAMRGKNGNMKIGRLVEWLRTAKGPIYTSRLLPETGASQEQIVELRKVIGVLPEGEEREARIAELATKEIEAELIAGGGFEGLVAFPMQEVINRFRCHPYFDSTVAYAIALAAYEGHDMTIYGADYEFQTPNGYMLSEKGRACCEWWVGQAIQCGVDVDITRASSLMNANKPDNPYGYDGVNIEGALDQQGNILISMSDRALPSAQEIELRYYKGPPTQAGFDQHMAELRRG